jgi:hypothetical protein
MRCLVIARLKRGRGRALTEAVEQETLGRGPIAGDEHQRNTAAVRGLDDGRVQWVGVCYCPPPLEEERPRLPGGRFRARLRDSQYLTTSPMFSRQ